MEAYKENLKSKVASKNSDLPRNLSEFGFPNPYKKQYEEGKSSYEGFDFPKPIPQQDRRFGQKRLNFSQAGSSILKQNATMSNSVNSSQASFKSKGFSIAPNKEKESKKVIGNKYYDDEGRKLIQDKMMDEINKMRQMMQRLETGDNQAKDEISQYTGNINFSGKLSVGSYGQPDVIWTHPKSGAKVFVGCQTAASTLKILEQNQIYHIVNCQGMTSQNYHENNPKFTYLRFSIGNHYSSPWDAESSRGLLRFLNPLWNFIETKLEEGHNILIHCLAGAHRAGTAAISWLMYADKLNAKDGIKLAQKRRDCISPIGNFEKLLNTLEVALQSRTLLEDIRRMVNVTEDLKKIHVATYNDLG